MLYRLTGDKHPVHVDPSVAAAMGLDRPILHGLATMDHSQGRGRRRQRPSIGPVRSHGTLLQIRLPRMPAADRPDTHQATARVEASVDGTITMTGAFTY